MIELKIKFRLKTLFFSIIFLIILVGMGLVFSAGPVSFTVQSPTNNSITNVRWIWLNITLNTTLGNASNTGYCKATVGVQNYTGAASYLNGTSNITMINDSTTHWYVNLTILLNDTYYAKYHNVTFRCNDTIGSGNYSTSGIYRFQVDTTNPAITYHANFTQGNTTTSTFLKANFTVEDNTTNACGFYIRHKDATSTNVTGTLTAVNYTRYCNRTITSSDASQEGNFTITYWTTDAIGNTANGSTTEEGMISVLASGWNLVSFTGVSRATGETSGSVSGGNNDTLSNTINLLPYCTYMSLWNNFITYKNYTTYGAATPSVNNVSTAYLGNATWIYCTSAQYYFRKNYLDRLEIDGNQTLWLNESATVGTKWNLVGLTKDKTLNQTLYIPQTAIKRPEGTINITAVSWYNTSLGHYISCPKDLGGSLCTGGYNATGVQLRDSQAVWIHIAANITINRTVM